MNYKINLGDCEKIITSINNYVSYDKGGGLYMLTFNHEIYNRSLRDIYFNRIIEKLILIFKNMKINKKSYNFQILKEFERKSKKNNGPNEIKIPHQKSKIFKNFSKEFLTPMQYEFVKDYLNFIIQF